MDVGNLGYTFNMAFFQTNLKREERKEVINYLIKYPWVNYVSTGTGKWDLLMIVTARDRKHLDKIVEEISMRIKPITYSIFIVTKKCYYIKCSRQKNNGFHSY